MFDGLLYESTGLNGSSSLRRIDPLTGEVLQQHDLPFDQFAEGLARVGESLIQLTWRSGVALVYDIETFDLVGEHSYEGEGWGLCFDGERLVMSDGSSTLFLRNAETFAVEETVDVRLGGAPVSQLNELECVGSSVYANVWMSDSIVRIDRGSGAVDLIVDAAGLLTAEEAESADILNGIAHDPSSGRFFLTGKLWPKLFEVEWEDGSEDSGADDGGSSGEAGDEGTEDGDDGSSEAGADGVGTEDAGSGATPSHAGCGCALSGAAAPSMGPLQWLMWLAAPGWVVRRPTRSSPRIDRRT